MIRKSVFITLLGCLVACAGTSPPPMIGGPIPDRRADAGTVPADPDAALRIAPAVGYRAVARLERRDSIILTLPDGQKQIQKTQRTARFSIAVSTDGKIEVRLDSLSFFPPMGGAGSEAVGTTWRGRLGSHGATDLTANRSNSVVKDLTSTVQELFPDLPRAGVTVGADWTDTSRTPRRVEIFEADDHREGTWHLTAAKPLEGLMVHAIRGTESYEQLGEGEQAGRTMRMSAQGRRSVTYYVTRSGRIDQIVQVDSASRLITIPETHQAIPTTQVIHTTVRFRYGS